MIQKGDVPDALKGFSIIKVDTQALLGIDKESGDSRVQILINEIKQKGNTILFIDEIHTLMNSSESGALDFANMFKTGLGRGDIKVIGATTIDEYERYVLKDKAFARRFKKVEIAEPDKESTVKIVFGSILKLEKKTGVKMGYSDFKQKEIVEFLTELTSEFNRVYENASRYPDVTLTLLAECFSEAVFNNKSVVTIFDVEKAIVNTKILYEDVKGKYLESFKKRFQTLYESEK